MAVAWTKEQQQVIDLRHRNILVSAAAGSGKTAVLVERILTMITDPINPVDIDSLLIVTFTRAAASEMRERIRAAIEKRLEEQPEDEHLQRQSTLIHSAQINTIDGFCSYVLRNYFHMIDLDPGYRAADEGELKLLKTDVMREVVEEAYAGKSQEFLDFVECYAAGKSDAAVGEYVLQLYEYSVSYPWPREWLQSCRNLYHVESPEALNDTPWMAVMNEEVVRKLKDAREMTKEALDICYSDEGPYMYLDALEADDALIASLADTNAFDERVAIMAELTYARLSGKKDERVSELLKERVKDLRSQVKDILNGLRDSCFFLEAKQVMKDMERCSGPMTALIDLALTFTDAFAARKREKNLVDFSDMEHFALNILWERGEEGEGPTAAGRELAERFEEIFIDEYQDSNLVQERILTAVSRRHEGKYNIFMVGDVKQSIYRFRLARPELFMEKFHTYTLTESEKQRIDLHKNFRSREEVLAGVNYIFRQIMGEDLGKVAYDDDAALYPGAVFPKGSSEVFVQTELLLVEKDGTGMEEEQGSQNDRETEALAAASRIREIVGTELVLDKETGKYRKAGYGDIVILLRTMSGWAETFGEILAGQGIPSYSASKTGYFSALEVVTVLNYLHILDNPRQDIPYGAVLHSPMGKCTAEELAVIRAHKRDGDFYSSVKAYIREGADNVLIKKLENFLEQYQALRKKVPYTPIHELIGLLLKETGYDLFAAAMPGGEQREANLRMLVEKAMEFEKTSYRGLFNFIRYIQHLQKYDVDFGEVNISGGREDIVRIMSIHKSKGLEFPIVFVSGMGKQFNQQDVNAGLIIHQDLGIGTDCIYPDRRIKVPTLIKQVIRQQIRSENLGEELRVLYVAMTRAKEKLILTGSVGKLEKLVLSCHRITGREELPLPYGILEKARSYLDWLLPALARHRAFAELYQSYGLPVNTSHPLYKDGPPLRLRIITPLELIAVQAEKQTGEEISRELLKNLNQEQVWDDRLASVFEERFSYRYSYGDLENIPVKVSVSELKKQKGEEQDSYELYFEPDIIPLIPGFIKKKEVVCQGAERGSAYHRLMECLDYERGDTTQAVAEQINGLLEAGKLDRGMAEAVVPDDIAAFVVSPLGQRMKAANKAKQLYREQPFVIAQPASTINPQWSEQSSVLVQGIIDAYFQENGSIVVVDYKTDAIAHPQQLILRYSSQLAYYAEALSRLTGKPVIEKYIYSFTLHKAIKLPK